MIQELNSRKVAEQKRLTFSVVVDTVRSENLEFGPGF